MMGKAVIAGVGIHPFGRFEHLSAIDMGAIAARDALRDAGMDRGQIGAAFCASVYTGVAAGHRVLGRLAMTGIPIFDVEAGCASGGAALQLAVRAVKAGQHDAVLVVGIEKMPKGVIRSSFFEPWQEQAGMNPAPAYFALRAQRLLAEQGLTKLDLARLTVKNRNNGVDNPDAMLRKPATIEQVLASRMICAPLHLWMLCSPNEGAAAVVVRRAAAMPGRDIEVAGVSLRSHLPGSVLGEDSPLAGIDDGNIVPPTTMAADDAYAEAGIGPDDIGMVECQDTDAARELGVWAELGLCAPGAQAAILSDGSAERGGRRPINPSGGLLAKGEPLGASAIGQYVELIRQMRGEAGVRQADRPKAALGHVIGRGANACVTIFSR